ncbi:MAG TPA: hypothetical protein VFJ97_00390 [Dermatophilaceae bacterium]|nr:hypothetical protein [Dermatophilaceae bacterium]
MGLPDACGHEPAQWGLKLKQSVDVRVDFLVVDFPVYSLVVFLVHFLVDFLPVSLVDFLVVSLVDSGAVRLLEPGIGTSRQLVTHSSPRDLAQPVIGSGRNRSSARPRRAPPPRLRGSGRGWSPHL